MSLFCGGNSELNFLGRTPFLNVMEYNNVPLHPDKNNIMLGCFGENHIRGCLVYLHIGSRTKWRAFLRQNFKCIFLSSTIV